MARDTALALKWLTPAAKAGDALGQSLLGDFYFNGEDGTPNRAIAEEWYARAARQGDAHAQDMLSWMLIDSDHRKPDYKQAMQWALEGRRAGRRRLHDPHRPPLQQRAGRRARRCTPPPTGGARRPCWATPTARPCWGRRTTWAPGVARDPVAALAWLMRARAARSPFADRFYAGVRESCTAEQMREAERRAGLPLELEEAAP